MNTDATPSSPSTAADVSVVGGGPADGWVRRRKFIAERIERTALELFAAAGGYDNVTVEQIADASGISVRTFFRYYTSKRDLLLGPPRRMVRMLCNTLRQQSDRAAIIEVVCEAGVMTADAMAADLAVDFRWGLAAAASPAILNEVAAEQVDIMIAALTDLVAHRLEVDPREDARPGVWAAVLTSTLQESFRRWVRSGATASLADAIRESFNCLPAMLLWQPDLQR